MGERGWSDCIERKKPRGEDEGLDGRASGGGEAEGVGVHVCVRVFFACECWLRGEQ